MTATRFFCCACAAVRKVRKSTAAVPSFRIMSLPPSGQEYGPTGTESTGGVPVENKPYRLSRKNAAKRIKVAPRPASYRERRIVVQKGSNLGEDGLGAFPTHPNNLAGGAVRPPSLEESLAGKSSEDGDRWHTAGAGGVLA